MSSSAKSAAAGPANASLSVATSDGKAMPHRLVSRAEQLRQMGKRGQESLSEQWKHRKTLDAGGGAKQPATPYRHGLKPGDHIYRWSHFAYSYPIQIHGIVLAVQAGGANGETNEAEAEAEAEAEGGEVGRPGDGTVALTSGGVSDAVAVTAPAQVPIVSITIADFGFTRTDGGDGDDEGEGEEDGEATSGSLGGRGGGSASTAADPLTEVGAAPQSAAATSAPSAKDSKGFQSSEANPKQQAKAFLNKLKTGQAKTVAKLKTGRRLNVIILTEEKDIKKWRKVKYGRSRNGGDGREGNGEDEGDDGTDKLADAGASVAGDKNTKRGGGWANWFRTNSSGDRYASGSGTQRHSSDGKNITGIEPSEGDTNGELNGVVNESSSAKEAIHATLSDTPIDTSPAHDTTSHCNVNEAMLPPSQGTEIIGQITNPPSSFEGSGAQTNAKYHPDASEAPTEDKSEVQTLEHLMSACNVVEQKARTTARKAELQSVPTKPAAKAASRSDAVRRSGSLGNLWPWKNTTSREGYAGKSADAAPYTNVGDSDKKEVPLKAFSKSDPAKIVLARVNFLLESEKNGTDVLPPYHVFNSNSECIAVFCKTGVWSSLQGDVFWGTTIIGNAKSSAVMGLSVAATQPWLIPAIPIAAAAAIGAPYFVLNKNRKKCEEFTSELNEQFWSQASPDVFVEAIHVWSNLKASTTMHS